MTTWDDIVSFNDRYFPVWRKDDPVYLTNALAGEVGELCNDTKHLAGGGTHRVKPTRAKMAEEMADAFIYLVLFSESCLGYDEDAFWQAVQSKLWKLYDRMK